jgi:HTH-type transcriptional regulator, global nitrogen regulator NrpRI
MDERSRRKILDVMKVLSESERPLGGTRIAQALGLAGKDMSQRTIRYYLSITDGEGLTEQVGRRGRQLTEKGRRELQTAYVADKVGFVAARADALTYGMDFKIRQGKGLVVVNMSTLPFAEIPRAKAIMRRVFEAGLSMGDRLLIGQPGQKLGNLSPGPDGVVVATVCSIAVNGVLLAEGVAMNLRFGGLLQMKDYKPVRFTQIINYDGTTLDPLEIFIKGGMTSVKQAARSGEGVIGASFREIPAPAAENVRRQVPRLERAGLGGTILVGRPGQPLLEVPLPSGRVGMVVLGGLNPLAAVEEEGIVTSNRAFGQLFPFEELKHYSEVLGD